MERQQASPACFFYVAVIIKMYNFEQESRIHWENYFKMHLLLLRRAIRQHEKMKKCALILHSIEVLVGQWRSLFQLPQNSNVPEHTLFSNQHNWAQMHLLFKQRGLGRENDNCVRLKQAKNTCIAPCAALHQVCNRTRKVHGRTCEKTLWMKAHSLSDSRCH